MQNKFFGMVSIAGTAIVIAFVMVIWMVWEINTRDIVPEDKRSESASLQGFYSFRTVDKKYAYKNISDRVQAEILDSLRYAKFVVAFENDIGRASYLAEDGERYKLYHVLADTNVFKLFSYEFIAGRPFTSAEMESGMQVLVINESSAKRIYGSAENAIGKDIRPVVFETPFKIVGVVKDVSTFFSDAFAQVWRPARFDRNDLEDSEWPEYIAKEGPSGGRGKFYFVVDKGEYMLLKDEIEKRIERYNVIHPEYTLKAGELFPIGIDNSSQYILILCVLLMLVPAINAIGLNFSLMAQRREEIGIRKAYGATRYDIINQLFVENLLYTSIGALAGFVISYIFILLNANWMFISSVSSEVKDMFTLPVAALFGWRIFAGAVFFCFCFNFMSIMIPAMKISGTNIIDAIKGEE